MDETLAGGMAPQFVVEVAGGGSVYWREGRPSSMQELLSAWQAAARYSSPVTGTVVLAAVVNGLSFAIFGPIGVLVFLASIVLIAWMRNHARKKRRVTCSYQLDDATREANETLRGGVAWLDTCRALWRVTHQQGSSLLRDHARVARDHPPRLITNVPVPSIASAYETLFFLPDALVVCNASSQFTDVPYSLLKIDYETTYFTETGPAPSDSNRVGMAWVHANKDGSRDRRRAQNYQVPQLEYARVTLTWPRSGCVLLASNVTAARHFANALQARAAFRNPALKREEKKVPLAQIERRAEVVVARPEPPQPAKTNGIWLAQGQSTTVHGFNTGDFVYVGNQLAALDRSDQEPSLIDPSLPVDPSHANTEGAGMTYWPSYAGMSAASRRAFLQWLAGGRKAPNIYIGYVFIFFYGLERRVYEFIRGRGSSNDELLAIANEVARLFDLYASNESFAKYASTFLDLIASFEPRAREVVRSHGEQEYGASPSLKVALGELAEAGKPIPAQHALSWVQSMAVLNTPALRCAEEFAALFETRYAKQFGAGLFVKANKTFFNFSYRPASAALERYQRRLPDLTVLVRPLAQLTALAHECSNALDSYSRFLGRNAEGRESLAAFALLPEELVGAATSRDASALASLVQSRFDEQERAQLSAGELLQFVRLANPERVSKSESMLLAQVLEKLGYGIEPDVRLGGPVYDGEGRVIVFRRLPDCPSIATDAYAAAALLIRLGAMVSATGDAASEERALLERHIEERFQLTAGERQRLSAHLLWLLHAGLGMTGLKRRIESLASQARRAIGSLLVDVAATDGHVDAREMKILEKLYDLLDLPAGDLYRDVHAAQAEGEKPVAITIAGAPPKGFAIPPEPLPAITPAGIDMERVRLKIAETRQVSTLLANIFVEQETPVPAPISVVRANTIGTLDVAHSELLRRLAQRERWPREEIERIAAELALLPDGALETINDYAYATVDEPLWEDDDPVTIHAHVARELTA